MSEVVTAVTPVVEFDINLAELDADIDIDAYEIGVLLRAAGFDDDNIANTRIYVSAEVGTSEYLGTIDGRHSRKKNLIELYLGSMVKSSPEIEATLGTSEIPEEYTAFALESTLLHELGHKIDSKDHSLRLERLRHAFGVHMRRAGGWMAGSLALAGAGLVIEQTELEGAVPTTARYALGAVAVGAMLVATVKTPSTKREAYASDPTELRAEIFADEYDSNPENPLITYFAYHVATETDPETDQPLVADQSAIER